MKKQNFKKIFKNKNIFVLIGALLLILVIVLYVLFVNISAREIEKYTEVTFVSPNQAIIFWRSDEPTLGYIQYGEKRSKRNNTELQTSSEEGVIHVVFIENIPPEGVYISKHNESDSFLIIPKVEHIQYDINQENNDE